MENYKANISLIRKYLNGELDARAMYELERRAQDDPALMDLMMGMELGLDDKEADLINQRDIDMRIKKRVAGGNVKRMIPWKTWTVAASLIFGVSIAAFFMLSEPEELLVTATDQIIVPADKKKEVPVIKEKILPEKQAAPVLDMKTAIAKQTYIASSPKLKAVQQSAAEPVAMSVFKVNPDTAIHTAADLNEVAIVGYSAVQKKELTASSVIIRGARTVPEQALGGQVAGVMIESRQSRYEKPNLMISGIITDADGNTPLPGVAVRTTKGKISTTTNEKGRFNIEVPAKGETLDLAYIGYKRKLVRINVQDSLKIVLEPDNQALAEVVVVGYGQKKAVSVKAQPLSGWMAYKKYLKEQATVSSEKVGKVTVVFTIDSTGIPFDIAIVKSSGVLAIDQKAVKLIADGSRWMADSDGLAKQITLKIKFH